MGTLTDIQIKPWIKAKAPLAKADGGGLIFTLSASGRASWILRYRVAGKAKEKRLGQYPDISLSEARRLASEDRAKVQQGVDVAAEKQRTKREVGSSWTVRQLAEDCQSVSNCFQLSASKSFQLLGVFIGLATPIKKRA